MAVNNKIKTVSVDVVLGAAQSLKAACGVDFAGEVILRVDSAASAACFIGDSSGQLFPLLKTDQPILLSSLTNKMSQSTQFDLANIYVKGTASDVLHVLLVDPQSLIAG